MKPFGAFVFVFFGIPLIIDTYNKSHLPAKYSVPVIFFIALGAALFFIN